MKGKVLIVLLGALVLLAVTGLTEYLFYRQNETAWVERFEYRLHKQEQRADDILETFKDSVDFETRKWNEDLIFVGIRDGRIFFWTHEIIDDDHLVDVLKSGQKFAKIGNTYYEIRRKKYEDTVYFALLRIQDDYPYSNKYVKDKFGKYLHVTEENVDQVTISTVGVEGGHLIASKEGRALFYIVYGSHYQEHSFNYLLISLYLLVFLSLFYVYGCLLKGARSLRQQLVYLLGFVLFLVGLRYFMLHFQLPPVVYRIPIFDGTISRKIFISSIGDLLLTTFCVFEVCYITLTNIKITYQIIKWRRFRYPLAGAIIFFIFLYIDFFNFSIDLVVENMDIHLNIAQLVHIGIPSLVSFVAISMGGMVIVLTTYGAISIFRHMMSFRTVVRVITYMCVLLCVISYLFGLYTDIWDCLFLWIIFVLFAINRYLLKQDIQRSIYILILFLLSIYVVMVTKRYESYKEQRQRMNYATELLEERDYNFEERLGEIDRAISASDLLRLLVEIGDEQGAEVLLSKELLDLRGYNYATEITFCRPEDSLWFSDVREQWNCREYFEQVIHRHGHRIGDSGFYSIGVFDGYVTYIGRYRLGNTNLYLRFDAEKDDEGIGYPQILSRKFTDERDNAYLYSYAKYRHGELVASSGNYVYSKKLSAFGQDTRNFNLFEKDHFSHMMIPVDHDNTLVISLHENTFSLYYMNVLYAFFVCILISSYSLFFNAGGNVNFRRGSLRARIKNNIVSLIFILFVILTALSIYMNTMSFKGRHNAKAIELLKYVNKELERLPCVDARECPEVMTLLSNMSELLLVDINIYSDRGKLVATSRPEIFEYGFAATLVNPKAWKQIEEVGAASYIVNEKVGELTCMSAYMPLVLDNGKSYMLNIPYFTQNDELNVDIVIMVIIAVNIAVVMMVLAFILSGLVADRVTRPLQMINDKLRKMRVGGKNEKIVYAHQDEVGHLVAEYNNMVDKLDESVKQLAQSERETAWREMARQIAHEIKNPLTPMKLNIQFMLRSLQIEDTEKFKERFKAISEMLIEQIDNMAAIASAFSDFAKMSEAHNEVFDVSELVHNCSMLFKNDIHELAYEIEDGIRIWADKEQLRRVLINLLKNAEQSIPEERPGKVRIVVRRQAGRVEIRVCDNGVGISENLREKIFQPNFTTKSSGMGLGLAICKRIIENLGGEIGFESTVGEGTEFFIWLDVVED